MARDAAGELTYRLYDDLDRLIAIRRKVGSDDGLDADGDENDSVTTATRCAEIAGTIGLDPDQAHNIDLVAGLFYTTVVACERRGITLPTGRPAAATDAPDSDAYNSA